MTNIITSLIQKLKTLGPKEISLLLLFCLGIVGTITFFRHQGGQVRYVTLQLVAKDWQDNYMERPTFFVPNWLVASLKKTDVQYSMMGLPQNNLVNAHIYDVGKNYVTAFLTLKLVGFENTKTHEFIYSGNPVHIGSRLYTTLNNIQLTGQVMQVHESLPQPISTHLHALLRLKNLNTTEVTQYKQALPMTMEDLASDTPVATISAIEKTYLHPVPQLLRPSEDIYDLTFSADLLADTTPDQRYYFNQTQVVKVGSIITISSDHHESFEVIVDEIHSP